MPLSKARDRDRKRQSRLDKRVVRSPVQPNPSTYQGEEPKVWLDADGNPVYDG